MPKRNKLNETRTPCDAPSRHPAVTRCAQPDWATCLQGIGLKHISTWHTVVTPRQVPSPFRNINTHVRARTCTEIRRKYCIFSLFLRTMAQAPNSSLASHTSNAEGLSEVTLRHIAGVYIYDGSVKSCVRFSICTSNKKLNRLKIANPGPRLRFLITIAHPNHARQPRQNRHRVDRNRCHGS